MPSVAAAAAAGADPGERISRHEFTLPADRQREFTYTAVHHPLSEDYDPKSPEVHAFYAAIQNSMLYAATSHTATELIHERSDPDQPNMGLTTWKNADSGRPLRKTDVNTAKNYLGEAEIKQLNRIVEIFLSTAELRAKMRQSMRLSDWEQVLENFLASNELPKLRGAGSVSSKDAERIAHERYTEFDAKRKEVERQAAAEVDDLEELKRIADAAKLKRVVKNHDWRFVRRGSTELWPTPCNMKMFSG